MLPENEVVLEPLGFHQRSESPPVSCQRVEAAGFSQEFDAVEVTLGGRQMERSSTVVVASFHVDRRRVKPVKCTHRQPKVYMPPETSTATHVRVKRAKPGVLGHNWDGPIPIVERLL